MSGEGSSQLEAQAVRTTRDMYMLQTACHLITRDSVPGLHSEAATLHTGCTGRVYRHCDRCRITHSPWPTWSCGVSSHCCQCMTEECADGLLVGSGGQPTNIHTPGMTGGLLGVLGACRGKCVWASRGCSHVSSAGQNRSKHPHRPSQP